MLESRAPPAHNPEHNWRDNTLTSHSRFRSQVFSVRAGCRWSYFWNASSFPARHDIFADDRTEPIPCPAVVSAKEI